VKPEERYVKLLAILPVTRPGRSALELAELLELKGTDESKREALARDVRSLSKLGIVISNVAEPGGEATYILVPGDSRIRREFPENEWAELLRAQELVTRPVASDVAGAAASSAPQVQMAPPAQHLGLVQRALTARCVLCFNYNGKARRVSVAVLHPGSSGWMVSGIDMDVSEERTFLLLRMSAVHLEEPGSAIRTEQPARGSPDPLTWQVDPPLTAHLMVPTEFVADVEQQLGATAALAESTTSTVPMTVEVVNRWPFLARLVQLGPRVRLLGPADLRAQLDSQMLLPHIAGLEPT